MDYSIEIGDILFHRAASYVVPQLLTFASSPIGAFPLCKAAYGGEGGSSAKQKKKFVSKTKIAFYSDLCYVSIAAKNCCISVIFSPKLYYDIRLGWLKPTTKIILLILKNRRRWTIMMILRPYLLPCFAIKAI